MFLKTNGNALIFTFLFLFTFGKADAITYYLKNNNPNTNWNDACNWYTNPNDIAGSDCMGVPGALDHVVINGHSFITLQNNTTIGSLHMDNGYGWIDGNYDLIVRGVAIVDHMEIKNNGKIYILGNLFLEGTLGGSDSTFVTGLCYFDGAGVRSRTLVLNGGGQWRSGGINLSYGGKLVVAPSVSLMVTHTSGSATMSHTSGGYFYNYGTLTKMTDATLTLSATNIATGGSFHFLSGKTAYSNNLTYNSCQVYVADGARLEFLNGDHLFYDSDVASDGYVLAAGNLYDKVFDANCTFSNDTLQLASGTWKFYMPTSVPNLLITGGASHFYEPSGVTESFWWSGGHLYGGTTITCAPQAHLYGGGGDRYTNCKFSFLGGMEWTDGNYIFQSGGEFNFPEHTTFYIHLNSARKFDRGTSTAPMGVVNTLGKVVKTGAGTASLNLYFNTTDSVLVYEGNLNLWRGTHNTSYFWINDGLAVQCTQAGNNFFHSEITGGGILRETNFNSKIDSATTLDCHLEITGGVLTVNCDITPRSLKISAGTLNGVGNIHCTGNFLWGNGTGLIHGSGILDVDGFATMSGSGGRQLYRRINLNSNGLWTGSFTIAFGSTGMLFIPAGASLTLSPTTNISNTGTQSANCGIFVDGSLSKTTSFEFNFQGADLTNNGLVQGIGTFKTLNGSFVYPHTGTLSPGLSEGIGTLNWSGLFENKATGNLLFDCYFDGEEIWHDSLHFYHNITLGGTFTLNADPAWPSDTFTVISWTGTKTGNFANVVLPEHYFLIVDDAAKKIRVGHAPQGERSIFETADRSAGQTQAELSIWPNPATDVIRVQFGEPVAPNSYIALLNISGQVLFHQVLTTTEDGICTIPVNELPCGIYFVTYTIGNTKVVKQIVVDRG